MEPMEEPLPFPPRRSMSVCSAKSRNGLSAAPARLLEVTPGIGRDLSPGLAQRINALAKEVGAAAQAAAAAKVEEFLKDLGPLLSGPEPAFCDRLPDLLEVHGSRRESCDSPYSDSAIQDILSEPDKRSQQQVGKREQPRVITRRFSVSGAETGQRLGSTIAALRGPSKNGFRRNVVAPLAAGSERSSLTSQRSAMTVATMTKSRKNSLIAAGVEHVATKSSYPLRSRDVDRADFSRPMSHISCSEAISDFTTEYKYQLTTGQIEDMLNFMCVSNLGDSRSASTPTSLGSETFGIFSEKFPRPGSRFFSSVIPTRARSLLGTAATFSVQPSEDARRSSLSSGNLHQSRQENDISIAREALPTAIRLPSHHELFPYCVSWFRCWGIVPISNSVCQRFGLAHANRFLVNGIAVTVIVYRIHEISHSKSSQVGSLTDLVLAVNGVACLMSSWTLHSCQVFMSDARLVVSYAKECNFHDRWRWQSRKHFMVSVLTWLSVVLARVLLGGVENWPGVLGGSLAKRYTTTSSSLGIAACAFESGIFTAVLFFLQHFLNGFRLAIDSFACRYICNPNPNCELAIHEWGMLRAILRLGSTAMWRLLMVPSVTSLVWVLLYSADMLTNELELGDSLPWLAPATLLTCMLAYVLWSASLVTSACERLPPIINSFQRDEQTDDQDRLVRYIQNSAAGFYIGDILLDTSTVLKVFNVVLATLVTVVTRRIMIMRS